MKRIGYTLPNGAVVSLQHLDFGLYVIAYNNKPLKEFCCAVKAKAYMDQAITIALRHRSNTTFRKAS